MTDEKVLVFGSFTEDEIKSLQCHPNDNELEITFGSLNSAILRSVGIVNPKLTKFEYFKGNQPLKKASQNALKAAYMAENTPQSVAVTVDENGGTHDLHAVHRRHGTHELKVGNEELSMSCVPANLSDPEIWSSLRWYGIEDATTSSKPLVKENLISSEAVGLLNSKESVYKASNGPVATVRNLLPRGLVNLGNLCFLNATLQALLSCFPFVQLLQGLRTRDIPKIEYPTLHAFVEFIYDVDLPSDSSLMKKEMGVLETGRPCRPVMFETVLQNFTPDVPNSLSGRPRQEDAQEFLSFVMHQMHDELLKFEGQVPAGNGGKASLVLSVNDDDDDDDDDDADGDDDDWKTVGTRNKTATTRTQSFIPSKLSAVFGGQVKSVVKARGNKTSTTIQPFLLLHLNICPETVCTIEDALCLFSASEPLEGYRMSASGKAEVVCASKSVKILELPEIMILHLMRFSYESHGSTKLHKPVRFPLELVLQPDFLVTPSSEGQRYELVATITHHGRDPSNGHYTADARHSNDKWLHYDDASVTVISTSKVLHDQAYILFYKQL